MEGMKSKEWSSNGVWYSVGIEFKGFIIWCILERERENGRWCSVCGVWGKVQNKQGSKLGLQKRTEGFNKFCQISE